MCCATRAHKIYVLVQRKSDFSACQPVRHVMRIDAFDATGVASFRGLEQWQCRVFFLGVPDNNVNVVSILRYDDASLGEMIICNFV